MPDLRHAEPFWVSPVRPHPGSIGGTASPSFMAQMRAEVEETEWVREIQESQDA